MLKELYLIPLCVKMRRHGNTSTSCIDGSGVKEDRARTTGMEEEVVPQMIAESSMEEGYRRELDNYLDYNWMLVAHKRSVCAE